MGEFNSDDHYIYSCGQESLRRNGIALIVNKSVRNAAPWVQSQKWQMILVHFQGKPFIITVIQVYAPLMPLTSTTNAREAEAEWLYEDLQDLLQELTQNKDVPFITGFGIQK